MARKLEIEFVGDTKSLEKAFARTSRAGATAGKNVEGVHVRMRKSFAGITASAAKMGAGVLAAYASIEAAKKAIDTTEELGKATIGLHKNLGLTIEQASRWAAVTKARGIDSKQLTQAFGTLSKSAFAVGQASEKQRKSLDALGHSHADLQKAAALAAKGLGPQAQAFKDLGLSTKDVAGANKDFQGFLLKVADGFGHLHAGSDKAALGMKLFGKGWQTVLPLLRGGSKALQDQLALADKYGLTLHGKTIKSIEEMTQAQRESKLASMGLQIAIGTTLIPTVTKGLGAFARFVAQVRSGGGGFATFRADLASAVTEIKTDVTALVSVAGPAISHLITGFRGLPQPVKVAAAAIAALGLVLAVSSPLGAGIALFAGAAILIKRNWSSIAPVIQDVRDAVTGWATKNRADIAVVLKAFSDIAAVAKAVFQVAFPVALAVARRELNGLRTFIAGALKAIQGASDVFLGILHGDWSRVWGGLKKIVSGALTAVVGALKVMTAPLATFANGMKNVIVGAFEGAANKVIDFINAIIGAINAIPGIPDIGKIGHVGGGGAPAGNPNIPAQKLARGGAFAMTGGLVNQPMVMMGEQAPRHPEFVIPTNPAYRGRAQGLLAQAAGAIGYAKGGLVGKLTGALPSNPLKEPFTGLGSYLLSKVGAFIKNKVSDFLTGQAKQGSVGPGGAVGGGAIGGLVAQVLRAIAWARSHGWGGTVISGFRSRAEQAVLYARYLAGGNLAAPPGHSSHESGQAVDVTDPAGFARALANAPAGSRIYNRLGAADPPHFSVSGYAKGGVVGGKPMPYVGAFKNGGYVPQTGMAMVHKGEGIFPMATGGIASKSAFNSASHFAPVKKGGPSKLLPVYGIDNGSVVIKSWQIAGQTAVPDATGGPSQEPAAAAATGPSQEELDAIAAQTAAIEAQTQAAQDLKDAIDALRGEEKRRTDYMQSVGSIERDEALSAVADLISGQIAGPGGYAGRERTASAGSAVRY